MYKRNTGSVISYNLAHWAGTHFSRPCCLIHGSGRVCLGSGGSRLRPSDMDTGIHVTPALLVLQRTIPQALTPSRVTKFIAWCLRGFLFKRMPMGLKTFLEPPVSVGYGPTPGSRKKGMRHTRAYVGCSTNIWYKSYHTFVGSFDVAHFKLSGLPRLGIF